jgi:all-trans-8'-apo-beta-carotenal 15,15'-oxygenase
MTTGKREGFGFGPSHYVGEPIFASAGPSEGEGWLLAQTLDGTTGKSFLAIFDARKVEAGPVARVLLDHHVPISFHGYWQDA